MTATRIPSLPLRPPLLVLLVLPLTTGVLVPLLAFALALPSEKDGVETEFEDEAEVVVVAAVEAVVLVDVELEAATAGAAVPKTAAVSAAKNSPRYLNSML